jgi:hypothetical protein
MMTLLNPDTSKNIDQLERMKQQAQAQANPNQQFQQLWAGQAITSTGGGSTPTQYLVHG